MAKLSDEHLAHLEKIAASDIKDGIATHAMLAMCMQELAKASVEITRETNALIDRITQLEEETARLRDLVTPPVR